MDAEENEDHDARHRAAKFFKRHEAVNVALLDIAALERLVTEDCAPLPLEALRALADDFRSLDELQRQLSAGLEECSAASSALSRQLDEERKERSQRLQDARAREVENARRVEELSGEMAALAEEAGGINAEIKRLREEALQACERKRGDKKKLDRCQGRLDEVMRENQIRRQAEISAARGLQELQDNCVKLGEEVQELRSAAQREAEEHERHKAESEEKLRELAQRLRAQTHNNAQLAEALKRAEAEAGGVSEEAARVAAEASASAEAVAAAEAKAVEVRAERRRQAERKGAIEEAINELKHKITELEEKDVEMQKEAQKQVAQLDKRIADRGAELQEMHQQKKALGEELERMRSLAALREAEATRVGEEVRRLQAEVTQREADTAAAREELLRLQSKADELRSAETESALAWERDCAELRCAARAAKERLEPAKRRLRLVRAQLLKEQRRAEARGARRAERLRHARRQLELEHVMMGSLERSLHAAGSRREALALQEALLRDADSLAAAQHARRMETQWQSNEALHRAEGRLLRSVAALEVVREHLRTQMEAERSFLHSLLSDTAALAETAQLLHKQQTELEDEILDFKVALDVHGLQPAARGDGAAVERRDA